MSKLILLIEWVFLIIPMTVFVWVSWPHISFYYAWVEANSAWVEAWKEIDE